ncbi:hypothetical protein KEM48_003820 [Puccinia striiformis f. sp. tritici PST-130]|nr:hypothetical protein KEM48_003820 [Puccinia striiformis f. sp. tritici PST-130]
MEARNRFSPTDGNETREVTNRVQNPILGLVAHRGNPKLGFSGELAENSSENSSESSRRSLGELFKNSSKNSWRTLGEQVAFCQAILHPRALRTVSTNNMSLIKSPTVWLINPPSNTSFKLLGNLQV